MANVTCLATARRRKRERADLSARLERSVDYCRRFGRLPAKSRLERLTRVFCERALTPDETVEADTLLAMYSDGSLH